MKVTFDQDSVKHYEFTHGHKPRGFGNWAFDLHRNGSSTTVWFEAQYTTARKWAMNEARSLGCTEVTVCT